MRIPESELNPEIPTIGNDVSIPAAELARLWEVYRAHAGTPDVADLLAENARLRAEIARMKGDAYWGGAGPIPYGMSYGMTKFPGPGDGHG